MSLTMEVVVWGSLGLSLLNGVAILCFARGLLQLTEAHNLHSSSATRHGVPPCHADTSE